MTIGSEKLKDLLNDPFFDFLNNNQKQRAVHLVSVHDKLDQLIDIDEIVLMEADSLGGMDPEIMGIFNDEASEKRFLRKSRGLRFSKFITNYSKKEFERLFQKRTNLNH